MIELAAADGGPLSSEIETTVDPLRAEQAIQWFEQRVPIPKRQWLQLEEQARQRAFTVAGVTALDVLEDLWREIDRALVEGTSFEEFKETALERLGSWPESHLETVFRTNVQSAYQAGRYYQMTDPEVLSVRPYWQFAAIMDSATTLICRPLDGVTRPGDDSWWRAHYPPLHFNCRSTVVTLTERQGAGLAPHAFGDSEPPDQGFGAAPSLTAWQPRAADYPHELWSAYEQWQNQR